MKVTSLTQRWYVPLPTSLFISHILNLTSFQKKSTKRKAQGDSPYIPVQREWIKSNEDRQMKAQKLESEQTNGGSSFMLQRWQQETTLDQPYHNLEAVKEHADRGNPHQTSMQNEYDSSVEYFKK